MSDKNLKQKAASGVIWSAIQKYSTMIVNFVSGIILARLLAPDDYGCIGMLAIFMALAENFIDGGFGSALIQKQRPSQTDYSTVFYFNLGMSTLMYLAIFFSAPAIARFYRMPLLCDVLRIQGLILFIYAFNVIQRNQIRKYLQFKKLSIITVSSAIVTLIVTVIMAYNGCGVWALVAQNIVSAALPCVIFWITSKWRPTLEFSWKSFKELFSFGFYMFLSHLVRTFSGKIQGLLIGRAYNSTTMGYYSKANSTESMASMSISGIFIQVTYPLYSEVQDDKKRLANIIKRITVTLSYITTPLMFVLVLCAKPIFILLYSDRWVECVPYFQILCVAGLATCLQAVNYQAIAAIGKSKAMLLWTFVKCGISIGLQVGGLLLFGLYGLLIGAVINAWIGYVINTSLVSYYIGYKNYQQYKDLAPTFIVASIAAAFSYYFGHMLHLPLYLDGLVKFGIFAVIYIGWSLVFKPKAYTYILSLLPSVKKKVLKK